jgi:hypothetical protein
MVLVLIRKLSTLYYGAELFVKQPLWKQYALQRFELSMLYYLARYAYVVWSQYLPETYNSAMTVQVLLAVHHIVMCIRGGGGGGTRHVNDGF